jgi:hypothetical protein
LAPERRRPAAFAALALLTLAVISTLTVQTLLLHRAHYLHWLPPVLAIGAAIGLAAFIAVRRIATPALAFTLGVLLFAPLLYAKTTWKAPVEGTFPAAGPQQAAGYGGLDVAASTVGADHALIDYVRSHQPGTRWAVLSEASDTAAPLILLGLDAGALGGYSATDPAIDGRGLARLVERHEARYMLIGGAYASRGGNRASRAAAQVCLRMPSRVWKHGLYPRYGLVLYDCAGRERALASA